MISLIAGFVIWMLFKWVRNVRFIAASAHIVDGDTITVNGLKWRTAGYDAPEYDQPGGDRATAALRRILAEGWCVGSIVDIDVYGRPVVSVLTRRGPLSWRMAIAGHAHGETGISAMLTRYARLRGRGLWAGDHIVTPHQWRMGYRPSAFGHTHAH